MNFFFKANIIPAADGQALSVIFYASILRQKRDDIQNANEKNWMKLNLLGIFRHLYCLNFKSFEALGA